LERDRAPQLGRGRAGDDRERHLRADTVDREQVDEQVALLGAAEAEELERVLAHVQVGLDRHLVARRAQHARRHLHEVADGADVRHHPWSMALRRPPLSWTMPNPHAAVPGSMPRTFTWRG